MDEKRRITRRNDEYAVRTRSILLLCVRWVQRSTSSIEKDMPALSGASKEISSTILSITVCSRLAPMFSTVLLVCTYIRCIDKKKLRVKVEARRENKNE
jgi:hypothetical protein